MIKRSRIFSLRVAVWFDWCKPESSRMETSLSCNLGFGAPGVTSCVSQLTCGQLKSPPNIMMLLVLARRERDASSCSRGTQ